MKTAMLENVKEATGQVGGWWQRWRTFLTEVRNELKRVTWPTRKEVYATTLVVVLTSVFFGTYLWGIDLVLDRLVTWLFRVAGAA